MARGARCPSFISLTYDDVRDAVQRALDDAPPTCFSPDLVRGYIAALDRMAGDHTDEVRENWGTPARLSLAALEWIDPQLSGGDVQ
jgi:hypothetical protein